jgi:hypothetical protein
MRERFSGSMLAAIAAASAVISGPINPTAAQTSAPPVTASGAVLMTPWSEPDLQGIWTDETDTPLQRSPKYVGQEFLTEEQRAELDKVRSGFLGRDRRSERGTEADVAGAYNAVFTPLNRTGARTSRIVDPPQRPAAAADHRGAETRCGRARVSRRAAAIDRNMQ